jgi:hypothetical protein
MKINVTEVSENYAYSLPNRRFATVALPIMSAWGDGCIAVRDDVGDSTYGAHHENFADSAEMSAFTYAELQDGKVKPGTPPPTNDIPWQRFPATQEGVGRFIAEFRGACDKFSSLKDYSYGYALTLLLNGYDIIVCRITDGVPTKNTRYVLNDSPEPPDPPTPPTVDDPVINSVDCDEVTIPPGTDRGVSVTVSGEFLTSTNFAVYATTDSDGLSGYSSEVEVEVISVSSDGITAMVELTFSSINAETVYSVVARSTAPLGDWFVAPNTITVEAEAGGIDVPELTPFPSSGAVFAFDSESDDDYTLLLPDTGVEGRRPINVTAIYPGTFGNRLWLRILGFRGRHNQRTENNIPVSAVWRTATVFVMDDQGVRRAVESFSFSTTVEDASETAPYWREAYSGSQSQSRFVSFDSTNPDLPRDEEGNIQYNSNFMVYQGSGNGSGIAQGIAPNHRWERRDFGFWVGECRATIVPEDTSTTPTTPAVTELSGVKGTDYYVHQKDMDTKTFANGIIKDYIKPRFTDPSSGEDSVSGLWKAYYTGYRECMDDDQNIIEVPVPGVQGMSLSQLRLEAVRQAALYYCLYAIPALTDKIFYEYEILMLPGWDDQNFGAEVSAIADAGAGVDNDYTVSQLHRVMAAVAVWSKCGVASLDAPRFAPFKCIKNHADNGLAQLLSQNIPQSSVAFNNDDIGLEPTDNTVSLDGEPLRSSKAHMVANWVQFNFPMLGNIRTAISPSLANLIIRRAQLKQQALQQFWCQPTNQTHGVRFGKVDNRIGQVLLEYWQDNDRGVGVNPIVNDPQMGVILRGNFTLFDQPEMTYNALRNLSTRYLFNEVGKQAFDAGRRIQLTYNNATAMGRFKAAMYPTLDAMMDAGAIDGYLILINPDINGLDHVNANSVVGNIYLIVNGVIQDIDIALIALPPGTDLSQFTS